MFRILFRRFVLFISCQRKKIIVSVSRKAITWGHPLVIAPYNESVGLMSFDSTFTPFSSRKRKKNLERGISFLFIFYLLIFFLFIYLFDSTTVAVAV